MKIQALSENQKREMCNVAIKLCNVAAEPGSGCAADHDTNDGDDHDEFDVMPCDGKAAISKRLQQADLLAFERDNPSKCQVDQEGSHQEKNRRQRAAHIPQHFEAMLDIGVR